MKRNSVLLRSLLLVCAVAASACVTSPYYTPASGSVYYVQDPWFYRNSHRDCYDVWYGCSRPYYGHSYYGGYYPPPVYHDPPRPRPPTRPEPPRDDEPVYAPKPPRLIRLDDSTPAPGRVRQPATRPPPAIRVAPKPQPRPITEHRPQHKPAPASTLPAVRQVRVQHAAPKPALAEPARVPRDERRKR